MNVSMDEILSWGTDASSNAALENIENVRTKSCILELLKKLGTFKNDMFDELFRAANGVDPVALT